MTSRHQPAPPVHPHGDNDRPAHRPVRDPVRQARMLDVDDVPDDELAALHAVVGRRMAEACARVKASADDLRSVLRALGVVADGQGTRTGEWGTRLGPARQESPQIAAEASDTEVHAPTAAEQPTDQPEATTDPPESTPDIPDGLVVWQIPGRVAHWPNACPQRRGQTACSGTRLSDTIAKPVLPAQIPPDRRCTSAACATRWHHWATGWPMRFRCGRCNTVHDHEESR